MKKLTYTLLFTMLSILGFSQNQLTMQGKVIDSGDLKGLPGATIVITNQKDSLQTKGTISNEQGEFQLKAAKGNYKLNISFIGYKNIRKSIEIDKKHTNIGVFTLIENQKMLKEITVTETLPPTKQIGDTTVFNPDAYKVNPDATAEELLAKMPGFYNVDGKIMAQGQEVKEVLVDGKKFFGNNVNKALETIPNDIIENVELYKYESDEAKFSGIEDKEKKKTINIVTNKKKKSMVFGRVSAGVGKDEKYAFNGTLNQFSDQNRITLSARSKNVNAPLRLNVKNAIRRSLNGNEIQQDNLAFNFNTKGKNNNELAATYYFDNSHTENESRSIRNYTSEQLLGQVVKRDNNSDNDRQSHNMNLYYQIKSNPKNQVFLNTSASLSESNTNRNSFDTTTKDGSLINSNQNLNLYDNSNVNLNQSINFMRNLNKEGRSISFSGNIAYRQDKADGSQRSTTKNSDEQITQNIDRISDENNENLNLSLGTTYSELIGETYHLSLGYTFNTSKDDSNKEGFNFNTEDNTYSLIDTLTTNKFENTTSNHTGRFYFSITKEKYNLTLGTDAQFTMLDSKETFPNTVKTRKDYFALLPSINYTYNIDDNKYFNVYYRMGANNPSAKQLQEVVNISSPLFISSGNADLKQSFSHDIMAFYTASNMTKGTFTSIYINANKTNNVIGQKTIVASKDTLINGKYELPQGGQFSQPVNLDGQYNLNARATYGLPVNKIKSKLNITSAARYSHTPTLVNEKKSFSNSLSFDQGFNLSSNISEKLDFTLSSQTNYSLSKSKGSSSGSEFLSQTTSLSMYWNFFRSFNIKSNASNVYKNNYSSNDSENNWLVDIGISTKVFKSKRGEVSLTAYDILNSKASRMHSVSELYTVDTYTKKLNKFYMLSFSYKIRNSKSNQGMAGGSYQMM